MSVKKYFMQVQKNQSTAQDDILIKPDSTKVSGMKHGNYDKLNDKGFIEEETMIEYGDVIFGKITPVSDSTGTDKPYRDTSEIYKVGAAGVIDRMYLDTSNQDGYEIRKCCVRSERMPKIGDKYCSMHGLVKKLTQKPLNYAEIFWALYRKTRVRLVRMNHKIITVNLNRYSEMISGYLGEIRENGQVIVK